MIKSATNLYSIAFSHIGDDMIKPFQTNSSPYLNTFRNTEAQLRKDR